MSRRLEAIGIIVNNSKFIWDDGFDQDDVTKIYVRGGTRGIHYIYFDYVKRGQLKEGSAHGLLDSVGYTEMFEINHLKNEHLESVEGYYKAPHGIQAVQFKTNFKTSQLMGYIEGCTKFSLAVKGLKIIGFHGFSSYNLNSLGAYFNLITPTKLKAKGGKGGKEWDDGSNHDNLSKIHVRDGFQGIQFISFDYVKNGQVINGSIHGVSDRRGLTKTFEINHLNNEYLVSVEGYYNDASGVIHGLQFKTNLKTFELVGDDTGIIVNGVSSMTKFSLAANGNKIIGFHGYAEKNLNSLGVYFTPHISNKLDLQGDTRGTFWDDGSSNDGIRKVYVDIDNSADVAVGCLRFELVNGGKVEKTHRRRDVENEKEFALDYPNEFITSVEGSFHNYEGTPLWIASLRFKTSKGRTSPTFGIEEQKFKFVLEKKGNALVGFYGYTTSTLNGIGAYYRPLPPPPNPNYKLEAKGGDGGSPWDDGGFEGVSKIYIGLSQNTVTFIKFIYYKDAEMVFGDDHGNKTVKDVKEFEINLPLEYLTSVEANYDDKSGVITMLRFKTNNKTSPDFGSNTISSVFHVHHKQDHKIVGFHGKSSNMLHQLGVHVIPI